MKRKLTASKEGKEWRIGSKRVVGYTSQPRSCPLHCTCTFSASQPHGALYNPSTTPQQRGSELSYECSNTRSPWNLGITRSIAPSSKLSKSKSSPPIERTKERAEARWIRERDRETLGSRFGDRRGDEGRGERRKTTRAGGGEGRERIHNTNGPNIGRIWA